MESTDKYIVLLKILFEDAEHLCSRASFTLQCNKIVAKKRAVRISRAGIYLKLLLIQCANNAIKFLESQGYKVS